MENKQKIAYVLFGMLIGVVVFVSVNSDSVITSSVVEPIREVKLFNCEIGESGEECDVLYPNGTIVEKGFRKLGED